MDQSENTRLNLFRLMTVLLLLACIVCVIMIFTVGSGPKPNATVMLNPPPKPVPKIISLKSHDDEDSEFAGRRDMPPMDFYRSDQPVSYLSVPIIEKVVGEVDSEGNFKLQSPPDFTEGYSPQDLESKERYLSSEKLIVKMVASGNIQANTINALPLTPPKREDDDIKFGSEDNIPPHPRGLPDAVKQEGYSSVPVQEGKHKPIRTPIR